MKAVRHVLTSIIVVSSALLGLLQCQAVWAPGPQLAGPTVKLVLKDGRGSAVHVGHGYFITAAHVIDGETITTIKSDRGATAPARVLWSNKETDVALLRSDVKDVRAAELLCSRLDPGASVTWVGNPLDEEFVTSAGRYSGPSTDKALEWTALDLFDVTVAPGMSGGGVFDSRGRLAGIIVSGMVEGGSFMAPPAPIRFSYSVPSWAVCGLLARK